MSPRWVQVLTNIIYIKSVQSLHLFQRLGSCGQVSGSWFLEYSKNRDDFGLHMNIFTDTDLAAHGPFLFAVALPLY